jgi:glucose-6-phosphate isomerase
MAALASRAAQAAAGLFRRDPATWSVDVTVQRAIANRLGWLTAPLQMLEQVDRMTATAVAARDQGITDVVLLGMGGSSLAPEVMRSILPGDGIWPRLHMLDSTDPAAIHAVATIPETTLFILASKSGTTIEPSSLAAFFRDVLERNGVPRWAQHFIAITDEGTPLETRAHIEHFREIYVNPSDIGGRYSALSFFGLVPAALMGRNVLELLTWGVAMLDEAQETPDVMENPAVALGLFMAAGAAAGRDKLTLVTPPALESFGLWVEQLVAESTGKRGVGIVPIAGESLGEPGVYGDDRLFVRLRVPSDPDEERRDRAMDALAGAPVMTIAFPEPEALGAEFARWEIATAVAGVLLGINPFDEPNVKQAKDATNALLDRYKVDGRLPMAPATNRTADGVTLTLSSAARQQLGATDPEAVLTLLASHDYAAVLAYLGPDPDLAAVLYRFRMSIRDRSRHATMAGYGPRYLHSTGQLHKGGPKPGVFVLITATAAVDIDIPGEPFSFGTLELAQGLGDFQSLDSAGRRAIHIHLPGPDPRVLERTLGALADQGLSRTAR